MKYCQICGAEINEVAEICPKCGVRCATKPESSDKSIKGAGLGVVLGLFLGLIGALICQFIGDDSAKKAGWVTFGIECVVGFLIVIIISSAAIY